MDPRERARRFSEGDKPRKKRTNIERRAWLLKTTSEGDKPRKKRTNIERRAWLLKTTKVKDGREDWRLKKVPRSPEPHGPEAKTHEVKVSFREAAETALGEELAAPITGGLMKVIGLLEAGGEGVTVEGVDDICRVTETVLDPPGFLSSMVDKGVNHVVAQALVAPLGPIGIGIAFFAGKFAGEITGKILEPHGEGLRAVEDAVDMAGIVADACIGQLAESDLCREWFSDLIGKNITAILFDDTPAVSAPKENQMTGQPATITAVLVTYRLDNPTGGDKAGPGQLTELSTQWKRETDDQGRNSVASPGDSEVRRVICIPEDAVAARWRWLRYGQGFEQGNYLLLTDGTLIKRCIHRGLPGRWERVSKWKIPTDQQKVKKALEQDGYKLISQPKPAPARTSALMPTPAPVDANLVTAYHALKDWATQNGVQ